MQYSPVSAILYYPIIIKKLALKQIFGLTTIVSHAVNEEGAVLPILSSERGADSPECVHVRAGSARADDIRPYVGARRTDCHTSDIGHRFANIHVGLDSTKNISIYVL